MLRIWIGKYIAAVGFIHCLLGVFAFKSAFARVFQNGFFNTINGEPDLEFPFWFVITGVFWIILGLTIDSIENSELHIPIFVGWTLVTVTLISGAIMPLSGWWLFLIPSIALIRRSLRKRI